jgi:hypothetical protein
MGERNLDTCSSWFTKILKINFLSLAKTLIEREITFSGFTRFLTLVGGWI